MDNYQLSIINYQLSTINYQLSTVNYQLSIKKGYEETFGEIIVDNRHTIVYNCIVLCIKASAKFDMPKSKH